MRFTISLLAALLCLFHRTTFAQATLRFYDDNGPVPFVSIVDTGLRFYQAADSNGICRLPDGRYNLEINHVSFEPEIRTLNIGLTDTLIDIRLRPRALALNEVRVRNAKLPRRKKLVRYGTTYRRSRSLMQVHADTRLGMVFRPEPGKATRYLHSVSFRLLDIARLTQSPGNLEVRVYRMHGGTIEDQPAHLKPIYLPLAAIRRINDVPVPELIEIPPDGVFVSLEMPGGAQNDPGLTLNVVMTLRHEACNMFLARVSKRLWNGATFPGYEACYESPIVGGYSWLNMGITYFDSE